MNIKGFTWKEMYEATGRGYNPEPAPAPAPETFSQEFKFVVFFVFMVLMASLFLKEKALFNTLLLILIGMVLTNSQKVTSLLRRYSYG